ncbi:hypothetical protein [Butyrivibrio sp. NC3005]|uniref:hypothetical protein n=1 Tax=Butyrivibrio sp. NC3005 TaxID=1280685 RepID=UPI0004028D84|nr:hypothetical protein [Butyrivibrio sp. NC3005]
MKKFLNSFAFLVCLFLIFSLECNAKEYITDIKSLDAGTVIEENKIDSTNLDLYFTSVKIKKDDNIYKRIYGKTYVENKDISLDDLRYLKMLHYNFDGKIVVGEMIVNKNIESNTLNVFKTFFAHTIKSDKCIFLMIFGIKTVLQQMIPVCLLITLPALIIELFKELKSYPSTL